MSNSSANILKRKIEAGSTRQAKDSLQNSLVKNLEKSIGKVFLDLLGTEVHATVSDSAVATQQKTINAMTSNLFSIVNFDNELGLSGFDKVFINATISLLTSGKLDQEKARSVTNTDAVMVCHVINQILMDVFKNYQSSGENPVKMSEYETTKAPLTYLLETVKYALLRIEIQDTDNIDLGTIELAIPLACIAKISEVDSLNASSGEPEIWANTMATIARETPIELDTIVQRMSIPLGKILNFKAGDVLDLTDGSLTTLALEGRTNAGPKTIFSGQLGALKNQKAFKVTHISDKEYRLF